MKTNCKQAYAYTVNNPYPKEINSDEDDDEDVSPTQTESECNAMNTKLEEFAKKIAKRVNFYGTPFVVIHT